MVISVLWLRYFRVLCHSQDFDLYHILLHNFRWLKDYSFKILMTPSWRRLKLGTNSPFQLNDSNNSFRHTSKDINISRATLQTPHNSQRFRNPFNITEAILNICSMPLSVLRNWLQWNYSPSAFFSDYHLVIFPKVNQFDWWWSWVEKLRSYECSLWRYITCSFTSYPVGLVYSVCQMGVYLEILPSDKKKYQISSLSTIFLIKEVSQGTKPPMKVHSRARTGVFKRCLSTVFKAFAVQTDAVDGFGVFNSNARIVKPDHRSRDSRMGPRS